MGGGVCHNTLGDVLSRLIHRSHLVIIRSFSVRSPGAGRLITGLGRLRLGSILVMANRMSRGLFLTTHGLCGISTHSMTNVSPMDLITFGGILVATTTIGRIRRVLT